VVGLPWSVVDLLSRPARLTDTQTGASLRPLSEAACMLISAQPVRKMWLRIASLAICRLTSRHTRCTTASGASPPTSPRLQRANHRHATRAQDAQHHQPVRPLH
jgi:hypothetical protein